MNLRRLPTPTIIEDTFRRITTAWHHVGQFHLTVLPGTSFGLRRYDQLIIAIETCEGPALPEDSLDEELLIRMEADDTDPQNEVATLLFVGEPDRWRPIEQRLPTTIVVGLDDIAHWADQSTVGQLRTAVLRAVDLRVVNPFTCQAGCRDSMFFGREGAIKEILTSPKESFAIVGPRRVGKTSLLHRLRLDLAKYRGQQYLYVDCSGITRFKDFAQTLLRRISPRYHFEWKGADDIENELIRSATRLKSRYLIALDEFDGIAKASPAEFGRIKGWFMGRFRGRIRFIVAGYAELWSSIEDRESYLYNVFRPITLGAFRHGEAKHFVEETLSELGIALAFDSKAVALLLEHTGLQPWLLQAFCSLIIERYASNPGVDPMDVVDQIANSADVRQMVFQATAMNCSPLGNAILACIASDVARDELSLIERFHGAGLAIPVERMIKELRLLEVSGAICRTHHQVCLTSKLLALHISTFWSFERSVQALRETGEFPQRIAGHERSSSGATGSSDGPTAGSAKVELFFIYSHKDQGLRKELDNHLSLLKRQKVISSWYDGCIVPGQDWETQILEHVKSARVILLLVSADFLASDYCYREEMSVALARHQAGRTRVIPVILRACDWSAAPFGQIQSLPTNAEPVTSWKNPDEAFADIARGIRTAIDQLETFDRQSTTIG